LPKKVRQGGAFPRTGGENAALMPCMKKGLSSRNNRQRGPAVLSSGEKKKGGSPVPRRAREKGAPRRSEATKRKRSSSSLVSVTKLNLWAGGRKVCRRRGQNGGGGAPLSADNLPTRCLILAEKGSRPRAGPSAGGGSPEFVVLARIKKSCSVAAAKKKKTARCGPSRRRDGGKKGVKSPLTTFGQTGGDPSSILFPVPRVGFEDHKRICVAGFCDLPQEKNRSPPDARGQSKCPMRFRTGR